MVLFKKYGFKTLSSNYLTFSSMQKSGKEKNPDSSLIFIQSNLA